MFGLALALGVLVGVGTGIGAYYIQKHKTGGATSSKQTGLKAKGNEKALAAEMRAFNVGTLASHKAELLQGGRKQPHYGTPIH